MIAYFLIWIFYIILDAIINAYIIEELNTSPNHLVFFIIRGIAAILWGGLINIVPTNFLDWLFFTGGSFWLLFDIVLNFLRHKSIFYIGETAMIDKLGNKITWLYWTGKLIVLVLVIISIINLNSYAINR